MTRLKSFSRRSLCILDRTCITGSYWSPFHRGLYVRLYQIRIRLFLSSHSYWLPLARSSRRSCRQNRHSRVDFAMVFGEVVIGLLFAGLVGRILLLTMDTLGRIVFVQVGLAAAQIFNPTISEQGTLVGLFLTTLGILFLFIFDLHHVLLRAIVDSFTLFQPGVVPPFDDLAEALGRVTADSFKIAVQFSAPFIVLGLIFYTCLGILARLMQLISLWVCPYSCSWAWRHSSSS